LKTDFNKDKLRKEYFLDPFYIYEYNEGHSDETTTNLDRAYWINQFTRTRPDRRGRIFKKGLIEITIHKHETE